MAKRQGMTPKQQLRTKRNLDRVVRRERRNIHRLATDTKRLAKASTAIVNQTASTIQHMHPTNESKSESSHQVKMMQDFVNAADTQDKIRKSLLNSLETSKAIEDRLRIIRELHNLEDRNLSLLQRFFRFVTSPQFLLTATATIATAAVLGISATTSATVAESVEKSTHAISDLLQNTTRFFANSLILSAPVLASTGVGVVPAAVASAVGWLLRNTVRNGGAAGPPRPRRESVARVACATKHLNTLRSNPQSRIAQYTLLGTDEAFRVALNQFASTGIQMRANIRQRLRDLTSSKYATVQGIDRVRMQWAELDRMIEDHTRRAITEHRVLGTSEICYKDEFDDVVNIWRRQFDQLNEDYVCMQRSGLSPFCRAPCERRRTGLRFNCRSRRVK